MLVANSVTGSLRGGRSRVVCRSLPPLSKAQALVFLVSDPFRQPRGPFRIPGVGIDSDQLAAGEGGHLYLLAAAGVGGELDRSGMFTPGFLDGLRVPDAADTGKDGAVLDAGQKLLVRPAGKAWAGGNV